MNNNDKSNSENLKSSVSPSPSKKAENPKLVKTQSENQKPIRRDSALDSVKREINSLKDKVCKKDSKNEEDNIHYKLPSDYNLNN